PHSIPMNRFRPNLVIQGGEPYAEEELLKVQIGDVLLNVVKLCTRCVIPSITQNGKRAGEIEHPGEPLKTLSKNRWIKLKTGDEGAVFGQNVIPETTGKIIVGQEVKILQTQPAPVYLAR